MDEELQQLITRTIAPMMQHIINRRCAADAEPLRQRVAALTRELTEFRQLRDREVELVTAALRQENAELKARLAALASPELTQEAEPATEAAQ